MRAGLEDMPIDPGRPAAPRPPRRMRARRFDRQRPGVCWPPPPPPPLTATAQLPRSPAIAAHGQVSGFNCWAGRPAHTIPTRPDAAYVLCTSAAAAAPSAAT